MQNATPVPTLINTVVSITRKVGGGHTITCTPSAIIVFSPNTIVNYYLDAQTPKEIVFTGFDKRKPYEGTQLSEPSISVDGRMLTASDRNTINEVINVTLRWKDQKTDEVIGHDPQIGNDPTD